MDVIHPIPQIIKVYALIIVVIVLKKQEEEKLRNINNLFLNGILD